MPDSLLTATRTSERIDDREVAHAVNAFVDAVNHGDIDAAVAQLAPDALHHARITNYRPDGVRLLFSMLRDVFPDLKLTVVDQQVDGRRVVSRIVATGTHLGSFLGKPATGEPMVWQSVDIAEIDTDFETDATYGKILKRFWDLWGDPALWKKIGFIPAVMC